MAESSTKQPRTGLTESEQKMLDKLMAKASAANPHGPAVRIGEPYVALTNLSVPRRGDKDHGSDLVPAGETVYLTDEEAALFMRHEGRDGRRVAVIRKKSEVDNNNPPKPPPHLLTGPVFRPGPPPPGSDQPRPDPAGSTRTVMYDAPPEASQPQPGSENVPAPTAGDAVDILPGGQLARDNITANADQDLIGAVKAQTGMGKQQDRR